MSDDDVSNEQLIAFAAGELDSREAAIVERYLRTHPEAAKTVARYRAIRTLLSASTDELPGAHATAKAQAIFRRTRKSKPGPTYNSVFRMPDSSIIGLVNWRAVEQRVRRVGVWQSLVRIARRAARFAFLTRDLI